MGMCVFFTWGTAQAGRKCLCCYASGVLTGTLLTVFPGWNAWYNWSIVLPAELSAAAIIASFYVPPMADTERYNYIVKRLSYGTTSVLVRVCQDNPKPISVTIFAARVRGGHQLPGQVRSIWILLFYGQSFCYRGSQLVSKSSQNFHRANPIWLSQSSSV
jgi:hypothetical protein